VTTGGRNAATLYLQAEHHLGRESALNESAFVRFVSVAARPRTWLGMLYHWLAFPLGLFYFVFLTTGLSVGVGLVVVWVGIPILLVVAGAWWLFGAFERWQARALLGADVPGSPREWERVDGVWAKLRAHFGSGSTWKDLLYLVVKLPLGIGSFTLLITLAGIVFWFLSVPVFAIADEPMVNGTWVPPLWFGLLCLPIGVLVFIVALHVLNAWGWVCARWAEVMFGVSGPATVAVQGDAPAPPAPLGTPSAPSFAATPAAPAGGSVTPARVAPPAPPSPTPPATDSAAPPPAAAPAAPAVAADHGPASGPAPQASASSDDESTS
jgi:hypothetical protein